MGVHVIGGLDFDADPASWRIKVDGWDSSSGSTLVITQRTAADGGDPSQGFRTPKDLVVMGSVQVSDPADLDGALSRLKVALPSSGAPITITRFGLAKTTTVYRPDPIVVTRYPSPNLATFAAQVRAADSRKLGAPLVGTTKLPASSGGPTVPLTVPFAINSTVVSGQVALTNLGDTTGPVILRIDGPCTAPIVTHANSGLQLVFASDLALGPGEWLEVDMDNKLVLANGQATRAGSVSQRGWSGFDPGSNVWAFAAPTFNAASQLTVTAWPAWQ